MNRNQHVVVVGAGQAGFSASAKLRALGHSGQITLIGEEDQPPYQRPPLSKAYLLGEMALERLFLRPMGFYAEQNIALKTSEKVEKIDPKARLVTLGKGECVSYDSLIIATGARPLMLPEKIGGTLEGVHYVRTLADADRMAADVKPGRKVLVVGGGYIGLEAAAVAAKMGLQTTLVEASCLSPLKL